MAPYLKERFRKKKQAQTFSIVEEEEEGSSWVRMVKDVWTRILETNASMGGSATGQDGSESSAVFVGLKGSGKYVTRVVRPVLLFYLENGFFREQMLF